METATLRGFFDMTGMPVMKSSHGQDYKSLVRTTNELIELALERGMKEDIDKSIDCNTLGIHSYAPTISFLKDHYSNDMSGRKIVEIGARSHGILALSLIKNLGADAHGIDIAYLPSNTFQQKSGIKYDRGRWEYISQMFEENSVDAIYINYMHPAPYENGPLHEANRCMHNQEITLDAFEKHITKEMHKVLKPNGLYIMREWNNNREYLFTNINNFSKYTQSVYPIESYGKGQNRQIYTGTQPEYKEEITEDSRRYPLNPRDKNMYFGKQLIVFQKRA
jgi:hypothetical protein